MGWLPDFPDFRDFDIAQDQVPDRLQALGQKDSVKAMLTQVKASEPRALRPQEDLREWCSPIENQLNLGSCTAQAGAGLVEYFERRAFGTHLNASRLFLYKVTRNLLHLTGDTGAFLRTTMAAMTLFGVPPEEYYPYDVARFDGEPPAFCYAFAQNYQAISYYRLDPPETARADLLQRVKTLLSSGLPSMFGFTVFSSYTQAESSGKIPYPTRGDRRVGGHAVVAVGYDDTMTITNTNRGGQATTGALLIRNSWGTDWGEKGYGWLPYAYVTQGLAVDWWSLLRNEWINTGQFGV
jgi:C1A family cysteine protease